MRQNYELTRKVRAATRRLRLSNALYHATAFAANGLLDTMQAQAFKSGLEFIGRLFILGFFNLRRKLRKKIKQHENDYDYPEIRTAGTPRDMPVTAADNFRAKDNTQASCPKAIQPCADKATVDSRL